MRAALFILLMMLSGAAHAADMEVVGTAAAERKAIEDARRAAREEAERKARDEAAARAAEAERQAKAAAEAERAAREEAERKAAEAAKAAATPPLSAEALAACGPVTGIDDPAAAAAIADKARSDVDANARSPARLTQIAPQSVDTLARIHSLDMLKVKRAYFSGACMRLEETMSAQIALRPLLYNLAGALGVVYPATTAAAPQGDATGTVAPAEGGALAAAAVEAERKTAEERAAREAAERKAAEERAAKEAAERRVAEERAAREAAQRRAEEELAARAEAERVAKEAAERQAAEERAAREVAERAAQEEAQRQAAERAAQEKAQREAAERAAQEEAQRQAAEGAAQEEAQRQAAERAAQEEAQRQAAERAAQEEAQRQAAERAAQEEAQRQAAERAAQEEAQRQAAERAAQEEAQRQAAERAAQEEAQRQTAERAAHEAAQRQAAAQSSSQTQTAAGQPPAAPASPPAPDAAPAEPATPTAIPSTAPGASSPSAPVGTTMLGEAECRALGVPGHCPDLNTVLGRLLDKPLEYNHPKQMLMGHSTGISLVLRTDWEGKDLPKELADALKALPGEVRQGISKITGVMSAELSGRGFEVSPAGRQERSVSPPQQASWNWQVTPTETGRAQPLKLHLYSHLQGTEGTMEPLLVKTFDATINVDVTTWDWLVSQARTLEPVYAVGAALIGLLTALMAFLLSRRREEMYGAGAPSGGAQPEGETTAATSGPVIGDLSQSSADGRAGAPPVAETEEKKDAPKPPDQGGIEPKKD
jgi:hypothetical protein